MGMELVCKVELEEFHKTERVSASEHWVTVTYGWYNWVYLRGRPPDPGDPARAVAMVKALLQLDA